MIKHVFNLYTCIGHKNMRVYITILATVYLFEIYLNLIAKFIVSWKCSISFFIIEIFNVNHSIQISYSTF